MPSVGDNWASVLRCQNIRSCELRFIHEIISLRQWFSCDRHHLLIFAEIVPTNRKVVGMEVIAIFCIYSLKWICFLLLDSHMIIIFFNVLFLLLFWAWVFLFVCCSCDVLKACLFVLGFCTKFPTNHCREDNSEESMKNSQTDHLPVILLGLILHVFWCLMGILVKREITSTSHMETKVKLWL